MDFDGFVPGSTHREFLESPSVCICIHHLVQYDVTVGSGFMSASTSRVQQFGSGTDFILTDVSFSLAEDVKTGPSCRYCAPTIHARVSWNQMKQFLGFEARGACYIGWSIRGSA